MGMNTSRLIKIVISGQINLFQKIRKIFNDWGREREIHFLMLAVRSMARLAEQDSFPCGRSRDALSEKTSHVTFSSGKLIALEELESFNPPWHSLTLDLAHLRISLGYHTTALAKRPLGSWGSLLESLLWRSAGFGCVVAEQGHRPCACSAATRGHISLVQAPRLGQLICLGQFLQP